MKLKQRLGDRIAQAIMSDRRAQAVPFKNHHGDLGHL